MKKLLFLFAAAAVLSSCVKESPIVDETPVVEERVITITATAPLHVDAKTRTQLVEGNNVVWCPGDVVKVCFPPIRNWSGHSGSTRYGYSTDFTSTATEMSATTCFQGNWTWSSSNSTKIEAVGFAIYPGNSNRFSYSADATTSSGAIPNISIVYDLPTVQEAIEGTFDNQLNLSYAALNRADMYSNTAKASFKNVCALLKFNLPQEDYHIKSIKIETGNESGVVAGVAKLEWQNTNDFLGLKPITFTGTPVTLQKSSNEDLKPGASYYALIWPQNHNQLKITFTNAEGNTCVKTLNPSDDIVCNAGECTTLNIKSLDFSAAVPFLDVATTSITASKKGGTESFNVIANNDVTVTIPGNVGWITGSYSNGQCVLEIKPNKESDSRSATITISSGGLSRNVTVTQPHMTYSLSGSALTRASDLADGQMYVVRRQATRDEYWSVNGSGELVDVTVDNTSNFISQHVFIFNKDDSKAAGVSCGSNYNDKYSYMSAGAWQSAWNDQYLHHNFYLQGTKYYFSMYSGWKQNSYGQKTGEDFDIYKADDTNMVNWNGSTFSWGNLGTDKYKWTFYKVVEN